MSSRGKIGALLILNRIKAKCSFISHSLFFYINNLEFSVNLHLNVAILFSIQYPLHQRCVQLLAVQVNFSSWEIWKFQLNLWPSVENVKTVLCFKLNSVLRYWGPERIDAGHTYYRQARVTYGPVFFAACNGAIDLLGKLYFLSGTTLLRYGLDFARVVWSSFVRTLRVAWRLRAWRPGLVTQGGRWYMRSLAMRAFATLAPLAGWVTGDIS